MGGSHSASRVQVGVEVVLTLSFKCCSQASEEASLRALESLMTEFFHNCTTNERKREIGEFLHFQRLVPFAVCCLQALAEATWSC